MSIEIIHGDNLEILRGLPEKSFRLIYMDPPFNTGRRQSKKPSRHKRAKAGEKFDRKGFKDIEYKELSFGERMSFEDSFDSLSDFLFPRIAICKDLLTDDGSIVVHLDSRELHYVKVFVMDRLFGRDHFKNEIIWSYDYGAKPKDRWAAKHDTLLWYVNDKNNYIFNHDQVDRVPYMAPGLVTEEKRARGKVITDVWWNTIVCGHERTGYPTQKPIAILERFVKVNSHPNDVLLDPFAGSGSFGAAAQKHGRNCVLIDDNENAVKVMRHRFFDGG